MKAYADLEQSKKLAEILPLESADMFWYRDAVIKEANPRIMNYMQIPKLQSMYYSPCWSLAALLNYLSANFHVDIKHLDNFWELDCHVQVIYNEELIDACYEIIIKLYELNLL